MTSQQIRDCPLGDDDAKFEQFAVNLRGTPERIGIGHLENQRRHIRIQRGPPAFARRGIPAPVEIENRLMPPYDVIRLHIQKGVSPSRTGTRQDLSEQPVALFQLRVVLVSPEHEDDGRHSQPPRTG